MTVDILLATYNGEKFLKAQLDSILGQTYSGINVIIRDDVSSDTTGEILSSYKTRYPDKITLISADTPSGSAKNNFFALMPYATSDYIMFADQDDVWDKDKVRLSIEKMLEAETKYGKDTPILIHTDLAVCDENLNVLDKSFFKMQKFNINNTSFSSALVQNIATGCTVIVNRALLTLAGVNDKNIIMHDWWLYLIASAFGRIEVIEKPLILYRQHQSNTLGAQKIGTKKDYRKSIADTHSQAKVFYDRFADRLDEKNKKVIYAYTNFEHFSKAKKVFYLFRYRLWKHSLIRRLGQIWFI